MQAIPTFALMPSRRPSARGWPSFRLALLVFAGSLAIQQILLARVVVPALISGASISDLSGLRGTLILLTTSASFLSGLMTGILAVLPAARRGAWATGMVRALVAICVVLGGAVAAAWLLREPLMAGTVIVHVVATIAGLGASAVGAGLYHSAGSRRLAPPSLMAIVLIFVAIPSRPVAAATGDYAVGDCALTTHSSSIEGGVSIGPGDAALNFIYSVTEHPKDSWDADVTVGFELDVSHDFVPLPVAAAARLTGSKLELKVGGRGLARIVNNYHFTSRTELEIAVVSAFALVTDGLVAFPALATLLPAEAPQGALPPAQSTEIRFGSGGFASISAGVAGIVGLDVRVENSSGVRLRLINDDVSRVDLAVVPDKVTSFDIGLESSFGLVGKGKVVALVPGIMTTGAGLGAELTTYSFVHFERPGPKDSSALAFLDFVPTSIAMETSGNATAAGVLADLLGPDVSEAGMRSVLGASLAGRSSVTFELQADLANLSKQETLTALATLFQAMASVARDNAGRPLGPAPLPIDLGAALRVIHRESAVRLSAARASGVGVDLEVDVILPVALSGELELSSSHLVWASYVDRSGHVVPSTSCRPTP